MADASTWEERMAQRSRERRDALEAEYLAAEGVRLLPDRSTWPVPPEIRGASARDAFLWYVCRGWEQIFGEEPEIENLFDHDFGYHVLRKDTWQLTFTNISQFPDQAWPTDT